MKKKQIINYYDDEHEGVPVTYTHQREQNGLAHALLTVEGHIDDSFALILEDNIFRASLTDFVRRQREHGSTRRSSSNRRHTRRPADTASVPPTSAAKLLMQYKTQRFAVELRYDFFYAFSPAIFHACHPIQPLDRGEYELSDAVDLPIKSARTIDAIQMDD